MSGRGIRRLAAGWFAVFALAFAAYLLTMQTGASWQDSGFYQLRSVLGRPAIFHALDGGIALTHPGYIALCSLASRLAGAAGNPLAGVTAVSALGGALALANLWLLVALRLAPGRRGVAALAAVTLGASHMFWWMSCVAEVYTWSCAFITAEILCLFPLMSARTPRVGGAWLAALAALNGLHLTFHDYAFLGWPVYAAVVVVLLRKRRLGASGLAAAVVVFALAAAPILALVAEYAARCGFAAAIVSLLAGDYANEVMGVSVRWASLFKVNAALFALNFLNPAWLLLPAGIWAAVRRRRPEDLALLALAAIHFVFFARYRVADQATFALPTLTLLAALAAVGADRLLARRAEPLPRGAAWTAVALAGLFPAAAYLGVNAVLHRVRIAAVEAKSKIPFRDEVRYWALPWKRGERSADRCLRLMLETTEPDAVLVGDMVVLSPFLACRRLRPEATAGRSFVDNLGRVDYEWRGDRALFEKWLRERPVYAVRKGDCGPFRDLAREVPAEGGGFVRLVAP